MGWPFARSYKGKIVCSLQLFIRLCEEKATYRFRWLALVGLVLVILCFVGLDRHYESVVARLKQLDYNQYSALQTSATEQSTKMEQQYAASIEQRSNEIAEEKLQHLEPRSYHLAQLIEKAARRVKTAKGTILWEIATHEGPDSPLPDCHFDSEQNWSITFYLPDTDGEIALSATTPSVDPKPKAKYRQGLSNKAN